MDKILRLKDVIDVTGIPRSSVYARMKVGTFPKQIKLSERSVGWRESDIRGWLDSLNESDPQL